MNEKLEKVIDKKLWLAPLAGHTDSAFRQICKLNGVDVLVTEMVSADGLIYNREKSIKYAVFSASQRPIGIQLFGNDPHIMQEATRIVCELNPDFIDINIGCPVKKVVNRGAGSALMKTPKVLAKITKAMKDILAGTDIILSGKIRAGWDNDSINYLDIGKILEDNGADLVCIHPRTRAQMFSGKSDWEKIKNLKEHLSVPVVGNGDITDVESALAMFQQTGCDSIMIGRGALGQPWLFKQIKQRLAGKKVCIPSNTQIVKMIKEHYRLAFADKGEKIATLEMRTQIAHYSKGMHGSSNFRNKINSITQFEKILEEVKKFYL